MFFDEPQLAIRLLGVLEFDERNADYWTAPRPFCALSLPRRRRKSSSGAAPSRCIPGIWPFSRPNSAIAAGRSGTK